MQIQQQSLSTDLEEKDAFAPLSDLRPVRPPLSPHPSYGPDYYQPFCKTNFIYDNQQYLPILCWVESGLKNRTIQNLNREESVFFQISFGQVQTV